MTKFWRSPWRNLAALLTDFGLITEFECFSLLFFSFFLSLSLSLSLSISLTFPLCLSVCLYSAGLMTEFRRSHDRIWLFSWRDFGLVTEFGCFSLFFSLSLARSLSLSISLSLSLFLSLSLSLSLSMQRRTCISNGGPSGAPKQNIGIFFLLTLSLLWSSWVFFLLPFSSLTLPTFAASSVHIVGSLISKHPSAIMRSCQERCSQPTLDSRL